MQVRIRELENWQKADTINYNELEKTLDKVDDELIETKQQKAELEETCHKIRGISHCLSETASACFVCHYIHDLVYTSTVLTHRALTEVMKLRNL